MKALIAYGTGRGSTGRIADAIASGMNDAGVPVSAVSIEYVTATRVSESDILGIGTPVHFYRETKYVAEFLSTLPRLDGKRAFVFCSCGMDRPGETLQRLHRVLSERGASVVGSESFRSAMSYYPHRKRQLGNGDQLPDDSILEAARKFGLRMGQPGALAPVPLRRVPLVASWKARMLANLKFRKAFFPGVRLNTTACTGYGSCLSRCLVGGIDRKDGDTLPFFTDRCAYCLECVAWCPRGAIEVDSQMKEWISTLSYRLGLH